MRLEEGAGRPMVSGRMLLESELPGVKTLELALLEVGARHAGGAVGVLELAATEEVAAVSKMMVIAVPVRMGKPMPREGALS